MTDQSTRDKFTPGDKVEWIHQELKVSVRRGRVLEVSDTHVLIKYRGREHCVRLEDAAPGHGKLSCRDLKAVDWYGEIEKTGDAAKVEMERGGHS